MINFIHIPKNGGSSMKKILKYNKTIQYHGHNAQVSSLDNQMIILRDPYDRFCSAVQYALDNYINKNNKIYIAGLSTPNHWAEAWSDPNHIHHKLILNEVTNRRHSIDSVLIDLKWTYAPQYYWINEKNVKYIILFDNIDEYFLKNHNITIPHQNAASTRSSWNLSNKSKLFIQKLYKKDFEFIEKYA
tara:strand:+ start:2178 stop:2741 length:564 start_codon:yes stop_codon:yes gene_type:complete